MNNLNVFQKIRIILFLLIIILAVVLITMVIKGKKEENYLAEVGSQEITEKIEVEPVQEITDLDEDVIENNDTSWDEDAEDTKVDTEEEEISKEKNELPYYIKINYTANCVTVYKKDEAGKYTVPVKAIVCSTGTATPTSGVYKMGQKYRWHQLNGGVYGQYCSRITGHILFHSVPYAKNTPDSLKYVAYDKLGTRASAGCIRLATADAIWIYNNCPSGTYVEFYASSNPGPLGKPSAQKISSNVTCRNWDPTDPTNGNPWHTYVPPVENKNEETMQEDKPVTEAKPQEDNKNEQQNNESENNDTNKDENSSNQNEEDINTNTNNSTNNENTEIPKEDEKKEENYTENKNVEQKDNVEENQIQKEIKQE